MKNLCRLMIISILVVFGASLPPYHTWDVYHSIREHKCISPENVDVEDICQRCAKFTGSSNVYPMCCSNFDDVQNWCVKATAFGH